MVNTCAAFNCSARYKKGENNLSFHRFPKDEIIKEKWLTAMRRKDYSPSSHASICSLHFRKEDFSITSKGHKYLRRGAIPSIFDFHEDPAKLNYGAKKLLEKKPDSANTSTCSSINEPSSVHYNQQRMVALTSCQREPTDSDSNHYSAQVQKEVDDNINFTEQKVSFQLPEVPWELMTQRERERTASRYAPTKINKRGISVEDFEESDLENPKKRHKYWKISQETLQKYKEQNQYLRTKLRREKVTVTTLNILLEDLKKKHKISCETFILEVI